MDPATALLLADALLLLHAGIVLFVVLGLPVVVLGNRRGWRWVNRLLWRVAHLAAIAVVALQAWLGRLCPLTHWEMALRARAGQTGQTGQIGQTAPAVYDGSFVAHWVGRLLYWDLPPWAFVAAYTAFGAAVVWAWWRWPPRRA